MIKPTEIIARMKRMIYHELHYYMTVDVAIHIGQDFSPETFCQGYGEIESCDDIIPAK